MFDSHAFYKKRLASHMKELGRYTRYIFNGHIAFALFFFIAAVAYYYQAWLAQLPENFPTAAIIGIAFGLVVSYSPVRTLLQDPDLVFLLPAEEKMKPYFRNSIIYSFVIQLYLILLVAAALGPLYTASYPGREGNAYLLTIVVLLIFKVANLLANWWMYRTRDSNHRRLELLVRTVMNILVFYFLIAGEMLGACIVTILFAALFLYNYFLAARQAGLVWDLLLEKDQNRMQAFYRIANMFSDVPHIKSSVRKRQWLVSLVTKNIPFEKRHTFDYLYRITFVRSGDYVGMYVRLIIIGGLFIYLIPNIWVKLLFVILFLYMSSFQMMTLYQHHRTIMWLDIYPVEKTDRQHSLVKLIFQLTIFQTILFACIFILMQEYTGFLFAIVAGIVFTYVFVNGYVRRKLT
ncbi:ABC transporter permease [Oceanobacillus alkalisoli]|uniref:ABC transporter permease n=1 Tax=Oceanobacillus alkalisoli TaxID=2925113 RepID=UPI001F11C585|nr:ABC transporter permease [Oceanobacillus alkalisoli]MCF3942034.1 ABC transporter permease [Oceanobacillus alkalisoli]